MKSSVRLLIIALCLCLVSACANETTTNSASTTPSNSTNNAQQKPLENTVIEKNNLTAEQQDIISALEAALAFTKQQDMVYFSYYNNVSNYYNDGTEGMSYTNEYADMQREPALVSLNGSRGYAEYQKNGDDFEIFSENDISYSYYYSKENGQFYIYEGDDSWHNDVLPDDFQTVEHIEDLITFFLQYPEQLSLSIEAYEGGFEEVDESQTLEYRRVNLDFSLHQFVDHTVFLTKNFFTGNHFPDPVLDSPYTIVSPELNNYSVSLLLDDLNRVNELYVTYETEDYDKTLYTEYNTMSVSFFYDKDLLPIEIVIPDEVLNNATDATGSRG